MSVPTIDIKGLSVSYGNNRVLTNIHLSLEPGNVYGVIGPNGAGKSTLFKAILGLASFNAGSVVARDASLDQLKKKIAYVPQKDEVDWDFPATVEDIVLMGRYPFKKLFQRINSEDHAIAGEALTQLGIEHLASRQIGRLSGGQQQRVFIARALCQRADIFFLDEPFVGVDITTEERIISILKDLAQKGKTILVVHHDLSTVEQYFNKVILLNQRLVAAGDTNRVFNEDNIAKAYGPQLTILHKTGLIE